MSTVEVVYENSISEEFRELADPTMRQISSQLATWANQARAVTNKSSLFDRAKYAAPDSIYEQMRIARGAVQDDDVVGGLAEVTEGMAIQGLKWEGKDADENDIWNQMAAEQDLDSVVRRIWREEFTYSQCVNAFWWDWGEFTVRGETSLGTKRKKTYRVWYPRAITTLDVTKVVPVGLMSFGQQFLAWQATISEIHQFQGVQSGLLNDELMTRFYDGPYVPYDQDELRELTSLAVDPYRLIKLNDQAVRRITLTKADHERFPDLRLKRVFKLLDLKQQLMEADRVNLIGAANYILLVKKGTKEDPAYPEEISNLKDNFSVVAKLPVIVSDHRLEIEIITPKQDFVLLADKYDTLDNRIVASVLGTLTAIGTRSGNRSDTTLTLGRIVARGLENRRHGIRRYLEKEIARAVIEHPRNKGLFKAGEPNIAFTPRQIALDNDAGTAQAIVNLRTMNELSRESVLEFFGFDQAVEAIRREIEKDTGLDDTFQTKVPFSATGGGQPGGSPSASPSGALAPPPAPAAPAAQGGAGVQGGRPVGGGKPSNNATSTKGKTASGATKPAPKGT